MSSQKGSSSRSRPQKYQNRTVFKNSLHDTSHRTKMINNLTVSEVCARCKEIIEWKIKYKKYKPLTQPAKCSKCGNRSIKRAYHTVCHDCSKKLGICAKCAKSEDVVPALPSQEEQFKLDNEMKEMLKSLPERKRRTFIRYMNRNLELSKERKRKLIDDSQEKVDMEAVKKNLMDKLHSLKINGSDDFSDGSDYDRENDDDLTDADENK